MPDQIRRVWNKLTFSLPFRSPATARAIIRYFRPELTRLEERAVPTAQILRSFEGMNVLGPNDVAPPDPSAAAGPAHIVQVVNTRIAVFNKANGNLLFTQSLFDFFNMPAGTFDFDPVVTYDSMSGRFIVIHLGLNESNQTSQLFVAVSNTSNPLNGWAERHTLNVSQTNTAGVAMWGDYPKLGFNREAVVVTLNMFTFPLDQAQFDSVQIVSINKATLLDRNPNTIQRFSNQRTNDFTMAAAVMHNAPPNSPMWFAQGLFNVTNNTAIRVTRMTNVLSNNATFVDFDVPVTPYDQPPVEVPQTGGSFIDGGDTRMLNAEWRNNRLVATHTIGVNGVAKSSWYDFDTSGATPTLRQEGIIDMGTEFHTLYSSIAISPTGFLGMTVMRSSANTVISMFVTGQNPNDPLGTMRAPTLVRLGAGELDGPVLGGTNARRVGDYSATTVDPLTGLFWSTNEVPIAPNGGTNWGTWIVNFRLPGQTIVPPGPPTPRPQPIVFPGRFIANRKQTNNTSDQAANLGTVTRGSHVLRRLFIMNNFVNLPDYDWYKFRIQRNGRLTVSSSLNAGQPLQLSLWRRVGDNLILVGRAVNNVRGLARLSAKVRLGELIYVSVQGVPFAPGRATQGAYSLQFTLEV